MRNWARLLHQLPLRPRSRSTSKNQNDPQPTGGGLRAAAISVVALCSAFAAPASAQIVPFAEMAGYRVAHVEGSNICFAATTLRSEAEESMIYSYYQSAAGQRWHVAGYETAGVLTEATVKVGVLVDGVETLSRETETRDGDFMLPFETLAEIEGFEALISEGETMEIRVGDADRLLVPLADYRAALIAIAQCLTSF